MSWIGRLLYEYRCYRDLPREVQKVYRRDRFGLLYEDPGVDKVIISGIDWICLAQDRSASQDGGVASFYNLKDGWTISYPETTGYIVPTVLGAAKLTNDKSLRQRARRMLDWLVSIQLPEGGFQGGRVGVAPLKPVTFNTGQILLGLVAGVREFGTEYYQSMRRAADFLRDTQDADGCWRKFPSPLVVPGDKTYEAHVAWGLFEAARIEPNYCYGEAGLSNVSWVLTHQQPNGWIDLSCLSDPSCPLTHTIGYTMRGILEAYRYSGEEKFLSAATRYADGVLSALRSDGFLPGRLDSTWQSKENWSCLTGNAQIAYCLLVLFGITKKEYYREVALKMNHYVRRTVNVSGPEGIRGGVKGSYPIFGEYHAYNYINWGCKFVVDSNNLERMLLNPDTQKDYLLQVSNSQ